MLSTKLVELQIRYDHVLERPVKHGMALRPCKEILTFST